ncbi:hypothetical protein [Actinacidiphila sp. ITFR-21]|uniref:hypothetical protein n=1 Tax=Actinacidiphila sp. ITFR-21 TaxID=3075199 RepID=UPI00288BB01E|nr:hypothetical protein [Streptomyces sp. ITFR-21]WNI18752.1 hypothetical protein RLT57_26645 [Streptomyces sp. ITFR-21]
MTENGTAALVRGAWHESLAWAWAWAWAGAEAPPARAGVRVPVPEVPGRGSDG